MSPSALNPPEPRQETAEGPASETVRHVLLRRVLSHREDIKELAGKRRVSSIRLIGSVARGTETQTSDIDFLVSPRTRFSLFDWGGLQMDLSELLGVKVDVVSARSVPSDQRPKLESEAISL